MLTIAELKKSSYICCGKGMLIETLLTQGKGKNEIHLRRFRRHNMTSLQTSQTQPPLSTLYPERLLIM